MKPKLSTLAVAITVSVAALSTPTLAEGFKITPASVEFDGAQERIDYSGKLRMLSQRIPSAACHLAADVDSEGSQKILKSATAEFEKILNALEFGDAELNIPHAEERRKTVAKIQETRAVWAPFKVAADAIAAGGATDEQLQVLMAENMNVLESAQDLVAEISGQYINPAEIVQADSFMIDMAGRQRMLTQKIAKESCMVSANDTAEMAKALEGTVQTFDSTLEALRFGMPAVGLRKPPTAGISAGLEEVLAQWKAVKPSLEAILSGSRLDSDAEAQKFHDLNTTMAVMNKVVGMYAEATKHEL